jgi:glycine cleavage system H protein
MSNVPKGLRYTKEHEWINPEGSSWAIGVTQFAANQLGDIVMAQLPKPGELITSGQEFGTLESVKAVSELFAPISGRVLEVNEALGSEPELINSDGYGEGWLIKIEPSDKSELDELMDADAYEKFIAAEAG